jgi:hypothetical protein
MKALLPIAVAGVGLMSGCIINRPQPVVVEPATTTTTVYRPGYVVSTLPVGYRTVRVNRTVYYVDRDVYYRPYRSGYVVVERPR